MLYCFTDYFDTSSRLKLLQMWVNYLIVTDYPHFTFMVRKDPFLDSEWTADLTDIINNLGLNLVIIDYYRSVYLINWQLSSIIK